jgi:hypothetical protein
VRPLHLIWLLPAALLGIALLPLPYGYYELLRIVVCTAMIFLTVRAFQNGQQFWPWLFIAFALLYNPITSVSLGRPMWTVVNLATIATLALHWWTSERTRTP